RQDASRGTRPPRQGHHRTDGSPAVRLSLSLCVRHAHRHRCAPHLGYRSWGAARMISNWILSAITFVPLVGVVVLLFISGRDAASENLARWIALVVSLLAFILSLVMWSRFDPTQSGFQFVENYQWIGSSIGYRMGVDGISVLLVVLAALMVPICIIASWNS